MYFINEFPWLSLRSVLFINLWCYTSEYVRKLPRISWLGGGKARLVKESKIRCLKAFFKELGGYPFIDLNMAYLVKIPCSPWKWTFMSETQRYRKLDQKSLKKTQKTVSHFKQTQPGTWQIMTLLIPNSVILTQKCVSFSSAFSGSV